MENETQSVLNHKFRHKGNQYGKQHRKWNKRHLNKISSNFIHKVKSQIFTKKIIIESDAINFYFCMSSQLFHFSDFLSSQITCIIC